MAEAMKGNLGQPVIIENVTGADGSIGTGPAARARPDGYTIDFGIMSTHALNSAFYSLTYDVLNDFAPIVPLGTTGLILVGRKNLPAKDLPELIHWLKGQPNALSLAVATVGIRLLATYFQKQTGTQFALVPYRGTAPALQDLVAGQIDLLFDSLRNPLPQVRGGSIKAYACDQ
jgi:tripartite-type tricarboxylate transporter receptor subunit TctC